MTSTGSKFLMDHIPEKKEYEINQACVDEHNMAGEKTIKLVRRHNTRFM